MLTLDLNGQYVYYFENIRDAFWSGRNPLYSWARNLSGGYQGVIGYYLASPFTFIVILLPRKMIIESLMIMPVYNALALGKFDFSKPDYSLRTMFNPLELIATVLPNQYYSVNVDEGTRMYGRPEIYCGVLTFVLLPLFFMNKKIKRNNKIGYGFLIFVLLFSMFVKPVNMMWHGGQDPNWLPYRYSFLLSGSSAIPSLKPSA